MERIVVNCACLWFIAIVLLVAGVMWLGERDESARRAFAKYIEEKERKERE